MVFDGCGSDELKLLLDDFLHLFGTALALLTHLVKVLLDEQFLVFREERVVIQQSIDDDFGGFGQQFRGEGVVLDDEFGESFPALHAVPALLLHNGQFAF